jgi:hypothetical protein
MALATWLALAGRVVLADPTMITPDPLLTPGAVRTTDVNEICSQGTSGLRHWSRARDDKILEEYDLPAGRHPLYEIDHLVPLGIGGSDDDKNLWAEPRRSIEPEWNAERKDELERKLRQLICAGTVAVSAAQAAIAEDWTEAWQCYVEGSREHCPSPGTPAAKGDGEDNPRP